ncbi:MAG: ATP-binding protein [Gammaproteobacteria bacterium]|nr:ATP-binding protein [Gammaproteobacteria bacterium]
MHRRFIEHRLVAALADTRVVLLHGARQTGKSTLAQRLAGARGGRYLTLDDPAVLGLARADPAALVRGFEGLTVLDEAQLAPALFPALKLEVDRDRRPGRFLLTGSASVFLLPQIAESLAGRIEILPLWPLAQDELGGKPARFVDRLFSDSPWRARNRPVDRVGICRRIVAGGFPEVLERVAPERRDAWFRSYVATLTQRDVRDLGRIEGLTDLPRLLALLAARVGGLVNAAEISRASGIAHSTLRRYLILLEAVFALQPLPAWSANLGKRLVRAAKLHLVDPGLTAHLRGEADADALARSASLGPLLESFVVQELRKQLGWSRTAASLYHFRTAAGREVDIVLEGPAQRIAGVEVKAAASVGPRDFDGLRALAEAAGRKFVRGVVLYLGESDVAFGESLRAVPLPALWESEPAPRS